MARLIASLPDGSTRDVRLGQGRITIGRRADNDFCLPLPAVSAEHAAVVTIGADSFLEDLDSTNGTFVNGSRITKHFLRDGDRIGMGRIEMVYAARDAVASEATATVQAASAQSPPAEPPAEGAPEPTAEALLADMMEAQSPASAVLDIPPPLSIVPPADPPQPAVKGNAVAAETPEALVTVLSGPNAGRATPMTRAQFIFGRPGVTVAAIRRSGGSYRLVPLGGEALPTVNGDSVAREGIELAFGDTIDVAGVTLRFERRV